MPVPADAALYTARKFAWSNGSAAPWWAERAEVVNDHSGRRSGRLRAPIPPALDIVNHFARQGAPILPVHDSFLVQARYQDELRHVMNQAYAHHTGGFTCPIKP